MAFLPADPPLTLEDLVGMCRPTDSSGLAGWVPGRLTFFDSGRSALWAALTRLGIGPGHEVLLPAYLCDSVVSPVRAVGARPTFYPIGREMLLDLGALATMIGPQTRAVILIHYLGFPAPVHEVRQLCASAGLALIEDCAHALFSRLGDRLLGSIGDAAIFSPWKSLPLPDGGLLALNSSDDGSEQRLDQPSALATMARLAYRALGAVETRAGWSPRSGLLRRPGLRRRLHDRTSGAPVRPRLGSRISWRLLRGAPAEQIVARRRENYRLLLDNSSDLGWACPLFGDLPEGVCPLGFPLIVDQRDRWRDELLASGVNVRTYWEHLPAQVDLERFPDAAWLRDSTLVLPVHQGLRSRQIDWLARRLRALDQRKSHGTFAHR